MSKFVGVKEEISKLVSIYDFPGNKCWK